MCGIIGIIGKAPVTPLLVEALKRLEYRGYDSAGVATLVNGHIERRRAEGKLVNLEARLGARAAAGHDRHRPHALGDPRQAVGAQRPSHRHRPGGDRAQRHHRELPGAEGRARGRGPPLRQRHRHRGGGAAPHLASRAPDVARGGDGQGDGAAARRLRAGRAVQRPPRHPDGRAPRQLARGRLRRRRDVYRHRRAGAGALHQARHLSRGRRLGRAERQGRHDLPGPRGGAARDPPERHLAAR